MAIIQVDSDYSRQSVKGCGFIVKSVVDAAYDVQMLWSDRIAGGGELGLICM